MSYVQLPMQPLDFLRAVVVLLFGTIILVSFVYGTLTGIFRRIIGKPKMPNDEIQKEPTKIIGGLSILMVALIANETFIYFVALLIGGLLIASERFMINLAAIFNSDRQNVYKISDKWADASAIQVEHKQAQEAEQLLKSEPTTTTGKAKKVEDEDTQFRGKLFAIKEADSALMTYLESNPSFSSVTFRRYVNFGSITYDAIAIDPVSDVINFGIEVRYLSVFSQSNVRSTVRRLSERYSNNGFPLVITFVISGRHAPKLMDVKSLYKWCEDRYKNTQIAFYSLNEDGKLAVINEDNFVELL